MLKLEIMCDSAQDARVYLDAQSYYNLIHDLTMALRDARKHGTDQDVVRVVDNFYSDLVSACDHVLGAY